MVEKKRDSILGLHRAEFEEAKTKQRYSRICEIVVGGAAALSVLAGLIQPYAPGFTCTPCIVYPLTILALASTVLIWAFSSQAKRNRSTAERARRTLLVMEGLDWVLSQKEITDLIAGFSVSQEEATPWEDPGYFVSTGKPGHERLATVIQQSAFFSRHLFAASAKWSALWFIATLLPTTAILFILPGVRSQAWGIAIAQIICILLMLLISIDFLGRAVDYAHASSAVGRVDERLEKSQATALSQSDLLLIWGDYNAAVQEAPLIPQSVYEKHRDRLNALFSQRIEASRR